MTDEPKPESQPAARSKRPGVFSDEGFCYPFAAGLFIVLAVGFWLATYLLDWTGGMAELDQARYMKSVPGLGVEGAKFLAGHDPIAVGEMARLGLYADAHFRDQRPTHIP